MLVNRTGKHAFGLLPDVKQLFQAPNFNQNTGALRKPLQTVNTKESVPYTVDLSSSSQAEQIDKKYLSGKLTEKSKSGADFIEDFAVKYQKLRQEILDDKSGVDTAEKLKMLDEVYKEEVAKAAKSLSETFEGFFDYGIDNLKPINNKMSVEAEIFDSAAFEKHVTGLAMKVMEVAKNNPVLNEKDLRTEINSALSAIPAGGRLENMSYSDIKIVSGIIRELPFLKIKVTKPEDAGNAMAQWNALLEDKGKFASLSDSVKNKVTEAIKNNIKDYHKGTAYSNAMNNYDEMLKDLSEKLEKLKEMRKKIDGFVKQYQASGNLERVAMYTERLANIDSEISEVNGRIRSVQENVTNLERNPDSVVNTEEYKQIDAAYKSSKNKLKAKAKA